MFHARTAPAARTAGTNVRQIRNTRVRGDELFAAVQFLGTALDIPALQLRETDETATAPMAIVLPFRAG
jgi:hypothetical protein